MKSSRLLATVGAAAVLAFVHPLPAMAGPSEEESNVSVTIEGGALEITVAGAPRSLGTARGTTGGATISGELGQVKVTDLRNAPAGSGWVASVVSTDFTPEDGPSIPASKVSYTAGKIEKDGTATYTAGDPDNLRRTRPAVTATEVSGNNTARWTPTIHVKIPAGQAAGVYAGTITHSVL